jgi:hypothetical protein
MAVGTGTALLAGGAAAGGIASGIMGSRQVRRGQRAAEQAMAQALAELRGVRLPELSDMELDLILPQLMGEFTPEQLQSLDLGPSAMDQMSIDPTIKLQQLQALSRMGEMSEGGLTEGDMAAARDIQRGVSQSNQARQEALLQNMAQRGVLGSGMELAARMGANQQAADAQSRASDQLLQQAQQRALQALSQTGQMAGQIRGQDFGEQAQIAAARDAINRFNVQNQQGVMAQNVADRNRAQQMNLAERQRIADAGTNIQNQQQMHNRGLHQQQFQNQMQQAQGIASALTRQGQTIQQGANQQAQIIGNTGAGLAKGMLGLAGKMYGK